MFNLYVSHTPLDEDLLAGIKARLYSCNDKCAENRSLDHYLHSSIQVNKKFRKFGRKYRDCIKRNEDKIGTQTCYDIST